MKNIITTLKNQTLNYARSSSSPFQKTSFISNGAADYLLGAIFVLLSIICVLFISKAKRNMLSYKQKQLKEYNKNRPHKRDETNYDKTRLFLPFWERIKFFAPIFFFVLFAIMAVIFFVRTPIQTL